MIKMGNITFAFDEKNIFQNFSMELKKGEILAIMGPSGCGKTTLLGLASGLLKPQKGEIVNSFKKISCVFQEPRLFDWLTVLENVTIVSPQNKFISNETARWLLTDLGLEESLHQFPTELSGGMKQRVSIARAIASEPNVILLDEPFKALDHETKNQVARYLFNFCKDKTVIMVTHDEFDLEYVDEVLAAKARPINCFSVVKSSI